MATMTAGFVMGCSTVIAPRAVPPSAFPAEFPQAHYRQAEALGQQVLHVSADQSLVTIIARRAGTLARLGHDHVIASHDVIGYVMPEEGRADLYLPLSKLAVDEPKLRAEAGFDTQPTPEAIAGTHNNMLTKVLDAERFPFALIHVERIDSTSSMLRVAITLHGSTRMFEVPVHIESQSNMLRVEGKLTLKQTDFGIVPFSVLGGAMQVADPLDLQFRISAYGR